MTADVEENTPSDSSNKDLSFRLGTKEIQIEKHQIPYFLVIPTSIILLICAIASNKNQAYAISVAVVALAVALSELAMMTSMPDKWEIFGKYIAWFMVLWNTIGAFILTFDGPFTETQNGYFACWALSAFAFMATGFSYNNLEDKVKKSSALMLLAVASLVTMVACIFEGLATWMTLFSLIVAILTMVLCGIFIYMDQIGTVGGKAVRKPCLSFFSLLWIVVVGALTGGPFYITSNGFFGAWAGLIFCWYAAGTS